MSDRVKPSRMLVRLEADIAAARTPVEADCRRAERVAYLARLGRFDEGRSELDALHQRYDRHPRVEVSAWCNLAEGLLSYFGNVAVTGDRVQRAYALSVAADLKPLRAICAAWLAQWDCAKFDWSSLAAHLTEALQLATPANHSARSRASLVAAQALHIGGRPDLAQAWNRRAKDHATAEGDDATISALMHNMAWLHMMTMRQAFLTGSGDRDAGRHALMSAESNAHFDAMIGDSGWQQLKPILRAQIVSLAGDAVQALSLYSEYLGRTKSVQRLQANLLADKSWCHAELGQFPEARASAESAINSLIDETQIDDRAATHSRLAQAFGLMGAEEERMQQEQLAHGAWKEFERVQLRAIALIEKLNDEGHFEA